MMHTHVVDAKNPHFKVTDDKALAELTKRKKLELFSIDKFIPWNRLFSSYVEVNLPIIYRLSGLKDGECPGMATLQHRIIDWYQERLSKSTPFLLKMLDSAEDKGKKRASCQDQGK